MERATESVTGILVPEFLPFLWKSALFLSLAGVILYLLLVATYPPIHDTFHDLRHALAIVPCH